MFWYNIAIKTTKMHGETHIKIIVFILFAILLSLCATISPRSRVRWLWLDGGYKVVTRWLDGKEPSVTDKSDLMPVILVARPFFVLQFPLTFLVNLTQPLTLIFVLSSFDWLPIILIPKV